jgi:phenylacetic acid degradation operon negative regulatory protein
MVAVKAKTEEFLNFLLWSAELLCRPTLRNVTEFSYEAWAYRKGLFRQVSVLAEKGLIEPGPDFSKDRLLRLTELGRLHALGGRDPQIEWGRGWDGRWRLVIFDVPRAQNARRDKLRRYLRGRSFGCLQGSVWITPDSVGAERQALGDGAINVKTLILLEARASAGESDEEIVAGAWDFEVINQRYTTHLEILEQFPKAPLLGNPANSALQCWAGLEREAWLSAVSSDPLLPERLLPDGYLGRRGWRRRTEVLAEAAEQLRTFQP